MHPLSGRKEMTTRRRLIGRGAGLVPALALAACGTPAQSSPAPSGPKAHPAVTLDYWSRWPAADTTAVEEKRVSEFNAANAPTKVVRTPMVGDYIEKLNTAFAAGTGPDTY